MGIGGIVSVASKVDSRLYSRVGTREGSRVGSRVGEPPGARGLNGRPRVSPHSYKEPALKARRLHLLFDRILIILCY